MLTEEECGKILEQFSKRFDWYNDNVEDGEQRAAFFCSELGVGVDVSSSIITNAGFNVDTGVVTKESALLQTLWYGIMLGKQIEHTSRVQVTVDTADAPTEEAAAEQALRDVLWILVNRTGDASAVRDSTRRINKHFEQKSAL